MAFQSGFVAIVGRPNVGKSTLVNQLIGEKIAIISEKPQTTRNTITCILNGENYQIVFVDTPGMHKPRHKLGEFMVQSVENTVNSVDAALFLTEATEEKPGAGDLYLIEQLKKSGIPVILVINKIDLVKKEKLLVQIDNYKDLMDFKAIIPISALKGDGIQLIVKELLNILPEGPRLFPEDMITDQTERQIVAELIREKALQLMRDEVPHGIGVEVTLMRERENGGITDINADIYCEKNSHKAIIIGKNGSMLREIGSQARLDIERLLGTKVYLELWVKVKKDWRNDDFMLREFGYKNQ